MTKNKKVKGKLEEFELFKLKKLDLTNIKKTLNDIKVKFFDDNKI